MKKIAVPTRNNRVDDHFGHCESYTVYSIDENKETIRKEILLSPPGCGCKSNISAILRDMDVRLMLAGNMGQGAYVTLKNHGIDVIRGCQGPVDDVLKMYLEGSLADSAVSCSEHDHHHQHRHGE